MGLLHSWVPPAVPGPRKVSSSPMRCWGGSQERAMAPPQPAQPQWQRSSEKMLESSFLTSLLGDPRGILLKYSALKAFAGVKHPPPRADQSPGLNSALLGHVQQQQRHHQKPLVETGVEGSYVPMAFCPRHSSLSRACGLWVFSLSEMFPVSAASTALWTCAGRMSRRRVSRDSLNQCYHQAPLPRGRFCLSEAYGSGPP